MKLPDVSDEILAVVKNRIPSGNASNGLTSRPGFTFGLGCDKWESSNYAGAIEGWDSEPMIRW